MRHRTNRTYQPVAEEHLKSLTGVPLANFWSRFAAFAIDDFCVVLLAGIMELLLHLNEFFQPDANVHVEVNPFHGRDLLALALYFGVGLWWGQGRTLGKRLLRIRVVSLTHEHISLWHSMERALGYGASVLEGGFGFVQFFIHPNRQTVHDRIAETIVIKETLKR